MSLFRRYRVVLMLFPALVLLFFFFLVPLSLLLAMSFYTYVPGKLTPLPVFTLENYKIAIFNPVYRNILISTLRMSLITTFFTVLLAYPIAYKMIRTTHVRAKKILMTFLIISFFMVIIIRVFAFIHVLGDGGIINQFLVLLGFQKMEFIGKESSVIISMVHQIIPLAVLSLMGSIKNIEPEYEEAAKILGATEFQTMLRVILPLSLPGIIASSLLSFAQAASAFITPMILGGGMIWMMANTIYMRFTDVLNYPLASAMSAVLLVVSLSTAYGMDVLLSRWIKVE